MKRYLLLASVAGCLMASNAMAGVADDAQSATIETSVTLKSAHVLSGTTELNFGELRLKRDAIPTDGTNVKVAGFYEGALSTEADYVQATAGITKVPELSIDGGDSAEDLLIVTCNTSFVAGKGCKISGASDDLNVYVRNAVSPEGSVPYNLSSLFSGAGDVELTIDTTVSNWEDLSISGVSAFTATLNY